MPNMDEIMLPLSVVRREPLSSNNTVIVPLSVVRREPLSSDNAVIVPLSRYVSGHPKPTREGQDKIRHLR